MYHRYYMQRNRAREGRYGTGETFERAGRRTPMTSRTQTRAHTQPNSDDPLLALNRRPVRLLLVPDPSLFDKRPD